MDKQELLNRLVGLQEDLRSHMVEDLCAEGDELDEIFSSGYSFLVEMAFWVERAGFRTGEVPITFVNRTEGASKISKLEIYKAMYTIARLRTSALPWERIMAIYHAQFERL